MSIKFHNDISYKYISSITYSKNLILKLSRRLWKDQGRKFQTQGRDHQQSEAYQATLTRTLSSMTSPSTTSDSASPLLYRFDSPPESAFSDPYTLSLSLSLSLFLFLLCLCLFVHVSSYFYLSLTCLTIYTQNRSRKQRGLTIIRFCTIMIN